MKSIGQPIRHVYVYNESKVMILVNVLENTDLKESLYVIENIGVTLIKMKVLHIYIHACNVYLMKISWCS